VTQARFVPGGRQVVTAGLDQAFQVRDADTLEVVRTLRPVPVPRDARFIMAPKLAALDCAGKRVALRAVDMPLEVRDLASGNALLTLPDVVGNWPVLFTPDGKQLLLATWKGAVEVRDAGTGKLVRSLQEHKGEVTSLAVSADGRWLASAG